MKLAMLIGTLVTGAVIAFAQGTMRPTPPTPRPDTTGNANTNDMPASGEALVRGQVVLGDGGVPEGLVELYAVCGGTEKVIAVADSKGRFSFKPAALSAIPATTGCVLRLHLWKGIAPKPSHWTA
jgi:hypothetical protein